jgi:hypothetical protein
VDVARLLGRIMIGSKSFWIKVGASIGFILIVGKVGAAIVTRVLGYLES